MALTSSIDATYNGKPLDVLTDLIKKRAKALGETTHDAVTATAINVMTSLRTSTRKAPLKGNRNMYTLAVAPGLVAGFRTRGGKSCLCVRNGSRRGSVDANVTAHCRNLVHGLSVDVSKVKIYKAQLFNENMANTVYYAYAVDERQVRNYIEKIILARLLKKESGMAKYAIGVAQAKISTRPMNEQKPTGARQWQIAHEAGNITFTGSGFGSGSFGISFFDALRYSGNALKGGIGTLDTSMMKAANKTAGLIHLAYVNKAFDEDVQTPFPEVKRR